MKNVIKIIIYVALALPLFVSCNGWLNEKNYGNPTTEDMMSNEDNVVLLVGQAYADVKWLHDHWGYWGVASLTSDECLCPVRMPGEHWSDGGYWRNLNTHSWDPMANAFKNIWNTTISGAVLCNKLLSTLSDNKGVMSDAVYNQYVGELETLRSYYYYMLFDCFGRIPYLEEFIDKTEPLMEPEKVWSRLVTCLEKNAPNLPVVNDANRASYYGRVTQGFAYALLARLYLNAESFGCTPSNISLPATITLSSASDFYNTRRRHQGLLRGKMHITPAQAWEIISHAQPPTQPIDPDVLWTKIAKQYHRIHPDNQADALAADTVVATDNALAEVAASDKAPGNDIQAIQQDTPHADSSTVMPSSTGVNALWPIPDKLWINKSGVVRVMGHGLYVGLRFKNRAIYSSVTDDYVEFFTDHDGEKLFSFPLPIQLNQRPPGGQININHVVGMWHRQPPELKPNLSGPRPSRRKKPS